jgi:hypothetical protein
MENFLVISHRLLSEMLSSVYVRSFFLVVSKKIKSDLTHITERRRRKRKENERRINISLGILESSHASF